MIDFGVGCKTEENNNLHKSGIVDPTLTSWQALLGTEKRAKKTPLSIVKVLSVYIFYHYGTLTVYGTLTILPIDVLEGHDFTALFSRASSRDTSVRCLRQCELLHWFSWLLAIGFFLVSQILDLGLPCSQEDSAYRSPSYQPISE